MATQSHFAAIEGCGECYFTGSDNVVDLNSTAPSGGTSFTAADAVVAGMLKHADIVAIGGPAYYTNAGATPDATLGFPAYEDGVMGYRNARALLMALKFFVPTGTTLKVSWGA